MKQERALRSITELIVRCCDPETVLLFGSYARGQENRDSDLDILVIGDFRESPYLRGHEVRELLRRYAIRIDLHLVTPEEVAAACHEPHGFLNSALASGQILYKRAKGIDNRWLLQYC
jgi:predicted nucleotidyltransferase